MRSHCLALPCKSRYGNAFRNEVANWYSFTIILMLVSWVLVVDIEFHCGLGTFGVFYVFQDLLKNLKHKNCFLSFDFSDLSTFSFKKWNIRIVSVEGNGFVLCAKVWFCFHLIERWHWSKTSFNPGWSQIFYLFGGLCNRNNTAS